MAKPDNLFLRVLWAVFFVVALVGNSVFMCQAVEQYLQFGVITTTKIKRESEMTLPAITFCALNGQNTKEMILQCSYGEEYKDCLKKIKNLTLYNRNGVQFNCVQINHGTNLTEFVEVDKLNIAKGEGDEYGYRIGLYIPPDAYVSFAVTDNSARVVLNEVREAVYTGQKSFMVLSKTVQNALGPPYSTCNETH